LASLLIDFGRKALKHGANQKLNWSLTEIRGIDLTQAKLGRILGVGQRTLSKYESGQAPPTLEVLVWLRAHSGRSIDWIVTGENEGSS